MSFEAARAGDRGILIRFESIGPDDLVLFANRAEERTEIESVVPGWSSLLVIFQSESPAGSRQAVLREILRTREEPGHVLEPKTHAIPVSFDDTNAPDLPLLLRKTGMSRESFLEEIARLELRARLLGFRPGFAYLEGLPSGWELPRRETPRRSVPAGSFAIAGDKAAFYPSASTGGWNLLGRTDANLWDAERDPPNLIATGDRIRLVPATALAFDSGRVASRTDPIGDALVTVLHPGTALHLVGARDAARNRWGMPASGPFDAEAAVRANRNVGNEDHAPLVECALSGPRLLWSSDATASWSGPDTELRIEGQPVQDRRVIRLRLGEILEIGGLRSGARGYLAVRSGFQAPPARDLPRRLETGDVLGSGHATTGRARIAELSRRAPERIRALLGPDSIPDGWLRILKEREWEVAPESDRAAVRFRSSGSVPDVPRELPSIGMQFGTVQWHPDGDLVAMGPDHPVTGGYLQPFTIVTEDLWKLAQVRPGDRVQWELRQ